MTSKQINEQLIKDVETAVNNVANAYNGAFKIKKSDEGTDRVSNFTLRLTSSEWNKDAQIKFSIDKPSEYLGDPDDPTYYAACTMGMRVNFYDGFVGTKHSIDMFGKLEKEKVAKFIETLFLPTSIEILKFAKANKRKYPSIILKKLKDFYRDMWKGTIKKVPTEEQIEQLFTNEQANESKLVDEAAKKPDDFIKNIGSKYDSLTDDEKKMVKDLKKNLKIDLWYSVFDMNNKWFRNYKTDFEELCSFLKSSCGYKLSEDGLKKLVDWLNGSDQSLEAYRDKNGAFAIYYADKKSIDKWKDSLLGNNFRNLSESKEISEKRETYEEFVKRFEEERQKAVDASKKFAELILNKEFDEAYKYIHSNEFAKDISWFGDPRKQIEHFEDSLFASKEIAAK